MPFEVFIRRMVPAPSAPTVTIHKDGKFSINRAALQLVGEPESVELLFDPDESIIGMRPCGEPHAYPVRPAPYEGGPKLLSASALVRHYGIDQWVSRRYTAYERDGVLCVDLKTPGEQVRWRHSEPAGPEGRRP